MTNKSVSDPFDNIDSGDPEYFLEVSLLKIQIKELVAFRVMPGDFSLDDDGSGSLAAKARNVLATGAKHIIEGRPSPDFLTYVANAINATLTKKERSLDRAFRLEHRPQRPQEDPYADPAIQEYLNVMGKNQAAWSACETLDQRKKFIIRAQSRAIDQAYTVRYQITPEADKARGVDAESIKKRKASLRDALATLGHYAKRGK